MSLLVDTTNIYRCARSKFGKDARLVYEEFVPAVERMFGPQDSKIAYVARPSRKAQSFATFLQSLGFEVKSKEPREFEIEKDKVWKLTDWAVEMTIDALMTADRDSPIILCSSDYRLEPLIETLKIRAGLIVVWAVGVPRSFDCVCREIEVEHMKNANRDTVTA